MGNAETAKGLKTGSGVDEKVQQRPFSRRQDIFFRILSGIRLVHGIKQFLGNIRKSLFAAEMPVNDSGGRGRGRINNQVILFTDPLQFADDLRRPVLFALIGSTIGNFEQDAAVDMLANVRRAMSTEDRFLLGADLRPGRGKSRERLTAAYNDSAGVTAEFNLNILTVINRGIGTDFDPDCFSHRAFYDADEGRIEMHLVSCSEQEVHFPGGDVVRIGEGETIRTEISCKYDLRSIEALFGAAGMSIDRWFQDQDGLYALAVGRVEP